MYDDARLWDALRRSYLVGSESTEHPPDALSSGTSTPTNRFSLETIIEAEGANLSVGERSLLSLARALVKNSKVVGEWQVDRPGRAPFSIVRVEVLDEAT